MKMDNRKFPYDQQVTQDQDHPTYFNSEASCKSFCKREKEISESTTHTQGKKRKISKN